MLISFAASFLVLTLLAAILVPRRGKPTGRMDTASCNFLKVIFSISFFGRVLHLIAITLSYKKEKNNKEESQIGIN